MKPTRVQLHIETGEITDQNKVIDSPFDIVPMVNDIICLDGEEGYFKVIKRQFIELKISGEPWIDSLAIIIKKI